MPNRSSAARSSVNAAITAKYPDDVQIRLDLAKCHNNLGELLRNQGNANEAVASFVAARTINEALVKSFPNQPRYSDVLASNLVNLAMALQNVAPTEVEGVYGTALGIYEKLVADYPTNADYRVGLARCLQNQGIVVAMAGKLEQAEAILTKAMANLEAKDRGAQLPDRLRLRASVLNNLGQLGRPGAEDAYRRSLALCQSLVDRTPALSADRHVQAIAQGNLGELLVQQKRLPEAGSLFAQSVANFDKLVAESPKATDLQSHFGIMLGLQAKWMDLSEHTDKAKTALASAIDHQREAVRISKNGPAYRELLGAHLLELAKLDLKLRDYDEAARIAIDLPKTVPGSNRASSLLRCCEDPRSPGGPNWRRSQALPSGS